MEENKVRGPDLEKYLEGRHHNYITYAQGARFYNLPYWTFVNLVNITVRQSRQSGVARATCPD